MALSTLSSVFFLVCFCFFYHISILHFSIVPTSSPPPFFRYPERQSLMSVCFSGCLLTYLSPKCHISSQCCFVFCLSLPLLLWGPKLELSPTGLFEQLSTSESPRVFLVQVGLNCCPVLLHLHATELVKYQGYLLVPMMTLGLSSILQDQKLPTAISLQLCRMSLYLIHPLQVTTAAHH